ncbi:hypothetical protein GCM10020219_048750 [Nonomuraea dietziae]
MVLKAADPEAAKRAGTVRLGLTSPAAVRQAHADLAGQLGADVVLAVQKMAPQPAVPTVVNVLEDPAFGPVVSFGLGDVTARLLRDRGYRLAPLTAEDAAGLVRSVEAAPLLFGEYGYPPVAVGALQELLVRVGRLANDLPEVARLDLDPVLVGESEVFVLGARAVLRSPEGPPPRRRPPPPRLSPSDDNASPHPPPGSPTASVAPETKPLAQTTRAPPPVRARGAEAPPRSGHGE